ncbi:MULTISPECIES: hypothetical protein [Paraburkholderia]|uniref:hypothetical protein n=1 Tax=Paraburkholderia TaxID=1822464 RepID=UPI00037B70EE|nr:MULTISPECIES: hypothetical protein [Paraburkholderia]MDH6149339.1 hypothetical protein [Paraburkholderia sp. WSM4179]
MIAYFNDLGFITRAGKNGDYQYSLDPNLNSAHEFDNEEAVHRVVGAFFMEQSAQRGYDILDRHKSK